MSFSGRPSQSKRNREVALKEKRLQKEAQRARRKETRANKPAGEAEEDPDIAGIVPGPQPDPDGE
jgi:hypothetical protein